MGVVTELRTVFGGPDERDGDYQCRNCHASFGAQYHVCPECGGYRVERVNWQISG